MAERLKDSEDRKLEALFRPDPVPDDGFSARVVMRVRRRLWVRRLSLPVAFVMGGLVALKPALQLVGVASKLMAAVPQTLANTFVQPLDGMFQGTTIILGIMLLGAILMIGRILEE